MEFFALIDNDNLNEAAIQDFVTITAMPSLCSSIDKVLVDNGDSGVIYCLWGQFNINREPIRAGIRFTMPHCPNALQWSITRDENEPHTVLYCSINKQTHEPDFIESLQMFVDDWAAGMTELDPTIHPAR